MIGEKHFRRLLSENDKKILESNDFRVIYKTV
jgi:hypothetical protein